MTLARLAAPALALLLATAAGAGSLVTPPLVPPIGGVLICFVANAGSKPREVHIDVLGFDGAVAPLESIDLLLPPGDVKAASADSLDARYCRLTFKGSAKTLRATVLIRDGNNVTLAALEAR